MARSKPVRTNQPDDKKSDDENDPDKLEPEPWRPLRPSPETDYEIDQLINLGP